MSAAWPRPRRGGAGGGQAGPDVETSSDGYARRFAGGVGAWFLEAQARITLDLLAPWPRARVLDVGGGHAQLTGPLVEAGLRRDVYGSDAAAPRACAPGRTAGARASMAGLERLAAADRAFDVVLSYRLLPHVEAWRALVASCAAAARAVLVDYPTRRSLNAVAGPLFEMKRGVEGNTRPFLVFADAECAPPSSRPASSRRRAARVRAAHGPPSRARPRRPVARARRGRRPPGPAQSGGIAGHPAAGAPWLSAGDAREWALALFRRSVLKQRKYAEIARALGPRTACAASTSARTTAW